MEQTQNDTTERVLEKIEKGQIASHSKNYFRAKVVLSVLILSAILCVSIALFSFISFSVRASDQATLLGFGTSGILLFLILFPWKLLLLDLLLVILLGYNLRSFRFGYSHPLVYVLIILFIAICIAGIIIDRETEIHKNFLIQADENGLPFFNEEYRNLRRPPPNGHGFYLGTISDIEDNVFVVELDNPVGFGTTSEVQVYLASPTEQMIKIGDRIFINGKRVGDSINATSIKLSNRISR